MANIIHITDKDNVVVAVTPIAEGTPVDVDGKGTTVTAMQDIPQGHKMAVKDIAKGSQIIKYGYSIGHAIEDIQAGQWVHTHNMKTNLSGEVEGRTGKPVCAMRSGSSRRSAA